MVSLLLLGLLWAAGCQSVSQVLTPAEPAASPTPTPSADQQTVTPTAEPALSTLESTPEFPAGPTPPRIVTYEPRPGEVVAADATLHWTFDQALDRESFAAGLRITPLPDGEFVWQSDREVSFEPAVERPGGLEPATRYSVVIDAATVRSAAGIPMGHDVTYTFSVLTPLQVTWVSPDDGAVGLRGDTSILVEFNHKIVPEACVDRDATDLGECPALPLVFLPNVMGRGTWLNTSLYRFEALGGFASGLVHEVVLDAGMMSLDGAVLAEPFSRSFETELPRVVEVSPVSGQGAAVLDTDIRVIFSTPMDAQMTGSALTVSNAEGVPVAGAITWRDNGAELVFSPVGLLDSDTVYQVRIGEGARAVRSTPLVPLPAWGFRTVPTPKVLSYLPDDGDEDIGADVPVRIAFAGAIDAASLRAGITVSSSLGVEDVFRTYDAAAGIYTLAWDRRPRTEYCVTVTDLVTDDYGRALIAPAGFCFETGGLPESLALPQGVDVVSLTADRPSVVELIGQNVDEVDFTLSEVGIPAVSGALTDGEVLREWTEEFGIPADVSAYVQVTLRRAGGALPTGVYQLAWQLPGAAGLPVHQLSPLDTFAVSGPLDAETSIEVFDVPEGAGDATELVVHIDATLSSFLADGLISNVRSMELALPDTTGAWVDELLPAVSIYGALQATGRESAVTERAAPVILDALERIYARQNDDGGWGRALAFGPVESDLTLTADVAYALLRVREAGLPVREGILEAALAWVADSLDEVVAAGARQVPQALAVRVLSEARVPWPQGVGATLYADRGDLGLAGRAHLAIAFGLVDPSDTRVVTLLDELRAAALTDAAGTTVHWEEMTRASPGIGTPWSSAPRVTHVQVTALALDVFSTLSEEGGEIPGAVAWLMGTRRGAGWRTSYETAWALTALADTLALSDAGSEPANLGVGTPSGTANLGVGTPLGTANLGVGTPVVVRLNGVAVPVVERAEMEDGTGWSGTLRLAMGSGATPLLRRGRNVLEIVQAPASEHPVAPQDAGEGRLYASVQLNTALPIAEGIASESRGLSISRRYCAWPGGTEVCVPVGSVALGELVTVRLSVTVPETRYAVRLEDPVPAGFELTDVAPSVSQNVRVGGATVPKPQVGNFLWVDSREDRAVFFAPELSPGTYEVEYVMRAVFSGSYAALPAVVGEVYFADIVARTTVATLTVRSGQEGR